MNTRFRLEFDPWSLEQESERLIGVFWVRCERFVFPVTGWRDAGPELLCAWAGSLDAMNENDGIALLAFGDGRHRMQVQIDEKTGRCQLRYFDAPVAGLLYQHSIALQSVVELVRAALLQSLEVCVRRRWTSMSKQISDALALNVMRER